MTDPGPATDDSSGASAAESTARRIGFLGPFGTFTQQALRTVADADGADHIPFRTVPDVLAAVDSGDVDAGFVPIENSIEGMVNFTQDALAFDHELIITNEVVIDIEHCLLVQSGTSLDDVHTLVSIPVATAQCHRYLRERLPAVEIVPSSSTADAARRVSESTDSHVVALAPRVAAEVYGLEIAEADVADHAGNQTRFVMVARSGVPAPTGHDRTALVVYQRADEPGSLIAILQEFAARRINLSNLFSRPTKAGGLGDYCFIMYADGHVSDELLADTMRALHAKQGGVKFLGSYPAAGDAAQTEREHAGGRWRDADDWLADIRAEVAPGEHPGDGSLDA
ncbi:MAG: prephenate dehydratase [Ilumatobacter sp.]